MKIAIDIMGGDNAPGVIIEGAIDFIFQNRDDELFFVGTKEAFLGLESNLKYNEVKQNIRLVKCDYYLSMEDNPLKVRTHDEEFSIVKCMNMLKNKEVDVVFGAGNSGGLVLSAEAILGLKQGASLPAIFAFTKYNGNLIGVLDAGATGNRSIKAENLVEFAKLGNAFFEKYLNYSNPTIKMLNIGEEEMKGTLEHRKAYKLLEDSNLNFQGNIESDKIFTSGVNIVVTDGFTGNIVLKLIGVRQNSNNLEKGNLKSSSSLKKNSNISKTIYEKLGGMPLLGVNGKVVMGHGKSNAQSVVSALEFASNFT